MSTSTRRPPASHTAESVFQQRDNDPPRGHSAKGSTESKHRFYQHQSHWDDFDDSPSLHSSSQIPSQAVALVEDGLGCIVDTSNSKCPLEKYWTLALGQELLAISHRGAALFPHPQSPTAVIQHNIGAFPTL
ncbi:hypothetical protein PSTG_17376 [Puccinia striiformis f. sp. tritici PST-78]|uniref:Uncharacterized protein n=1 Tax=Puccinia striiformis f. sp. tritici PST-78 TaxID=1165861 RepID=A0A0L0UQB3_9BASI|nr:hypothetical protein PSTG_17376 [Puccinia striiformis f. sp. tritici PST-78]